MEDKEKNSYGLLAGVILMIIGLILWIFPGWYSITNDLSIMNYLYFFVIGTIFLAASIIVVFFTGEAKGKKTYEGKAISSLKIEEKYKVLSIADGLKRSKEQTFLLLQEGEDEDNVITFNKNGCWLPKDLKVGSTITMRMVENEKLEIVIVP